MRLHGRPLEPSAHNRGTQPPAAATVPLRPGRFGPCGRVLLLTACIGVALLAWTYVVFQGRVEAIFYVQGGTAATGWAGYDGQFVYAMARDLNPRTVRASLDVPAYRYQRILLPLVAHGLSRGHPAGILWAVWGVSLGAHLAATVLWCRWWARRGRAFHWALLYGLWPGLLLGLRLGLPEPLAYALGLMGLLWAREDRWVWGYLALLAAVFAKELTWAFVVAAALDGWWRGARRRALGVMLGVGLPWLAWQGWLWRTFGQPGLAAGGWGATSVPLYPLGGLVEVVIRLPLSWVAVYGLVFGPSLLVPLALGAWWAWRRWREGRRDVWTALLALHVALGLWLPMSSWEPFAVFRVLTGLLVAFWAVALEEKRFPLLRRLTPFWMALLAFVVAR